MWKWKPDYKGMNGEYEEMEAVKTVWEKEDFMGREDKLQEKSFGK